MWGSISAITDFEAPTSLQGQTIAGGIAADRSGVLEAEGQVQLQQGSLSEHREEIQPAAQEVSVLLPPVYRN